MYLKNIDILNFKNVDQVKMQLIPGINCFVGNNGAGKTNLLDAIYYLSFCKSFFNSTDTQLINYGKDFFLIQGQFIRQDKEENIHAGIKINERKRFRRNKKEYSRLSDHIGLLPLVMITPGDERIITDSGEQRRKFVDSVISQFNKQYLKKLIKYNRILYQRNCLLKSANGRLENIISQLEVWDEQLSQISLFIFEMRNSFISELEPVFEKYYSIISGEKEKAGIVYNSHLGEGDYLDQLVQHRQRDIILGYTSRGIHRDDLELLLNGYSVRKDGSQGQKKTFLIALKFAQYDFLKNHFGFAPILLLDDLFDKLDEKRVQNLIDLVGRNNFKQIFITDTQKQRLYDIVTHTKKEYFFFNVANGMVEPENIKDEE